jgi:hypothetical protein
VHTGAYLCISVHTLSALTSSKVGLVSVESADLKSVGVALELLVPSLMVRDILVFLIKLPPF